MSAGVYAVVHRATGKAYIGSSRNVERRLIHHRSYINTGCTHPATIRALQGSSAKADEFDYKVLRITSTVAEAQEIETAFLESFFGDQLYNLAPHADGATGVKRDHDKYSQAVIKQWQDAEIRARRSEAMRGKRQLVKCPTCGKVGGGGNMRRYHFENCKA